MASETPNNETITKLQNHVNQLTGLVERINTIRKIPSFLLAPSVIAGSQLENGFSQIKQLGEDIAGDATQESLRLAHESFSKNPEDIGVESRRQSRKRRRPPTPTPESPRPPPASPDSIFPPSTRQTPLALADLPSFVRSHNATDSPVKLYIWTPTRHEPQTSGSTSLWLLNSKEVILRFKVADVLMVYVRLDVVDGRTTNGCSSKTLLVESATAFGTRERKSPHSQSDFTVYQKLSQHLAWMLQAEPDVKLDSLINLFASYESLFISPCTMCHRILSEEGHFPPVCRLWMQPRKSAQNKENGTSEDAASEGIWEPRHRTCFSAT